MRKHVSAVIFAVLLVASMGLGPVSAAEGDGHNAGNGDTDSDHSHTLHVYATLDGEPTHTQVVVRNQSDVSGGDRSAEPVAVAYSNFSRPGEVHLELDPGEYEVEVDAGGDHLTQTVYRNVTVSENETATVEANLTQVYHPNDRGWYGVDPHAHSEYSPDSETPIRTFAAGQLAAQLDAITISDHYTVEGHDDVKQLAEQADHPYLLSQEITSTNESHNHGHHNAYPLHEGEYVNESRSPTGMYADAREAGADVIQVNHPHSGSIGYFNTTMGTQHWNGSFDGAEVFNGPHTVDNEERTIQDMYEFWNEGKNYTAVSVSDDHDESAVYPQDTEYGTPRTYAYGDPAEGEMPNGTEWAQAVSDGHTFVTYGPLVYFSADGDAIPGDILTVEDTVSLSADLQNVGDLESARLIENGTEIESWDLSDEETTIDTEVDVEGSNWYVLRVQDAEGDRAMTNPIWVQEGDGDEPAPEPTPAPTDDEFAVTLDEAPAGLQSFNVTVAANASVSATSSDLIADRFLQTTEHEDGSVTIRGADLGSSVGATNESLTLATVEFDEAVSEDAVSVTATSLTDDDGQSLDSDLVSVRRASLFSGPLPGTGAENAPMDHDGDGRYEDVDGDGDADFDDAVALAFVEDDALTDAQVAALDFDGDGELTFADAIELAFEV